MCIQNENHKRSEMKKTTFSRKFWIYTVFYAFACAIICCIPALLTSGSIIDFTQTGQIGDTIGGIMGPIVAMVAAYLTFIAFWVQKQANEAQRQDIKMERFNANFYNLLNIHEQITSSLENKGRENITYHGREVFRYAFELVLDYNRRGEYVGKGMRGRIKSHGMESYKDSILPTYFDHYFRNMYRIVKFVDEAEVFDEFTQNERHKKKYEYVAILRSTLSRYELVWLFYNTLSDYGRAKFKPSVEKYALLNNIRVDLLVNPQDVQEFDAEAFGGRYPEE